MRLLAIAATLVLLAAPAYADRKAAERLFRAGEKAYKAQKFLIAAQNFEQAYRELPAPEIAFSVAQAYRRQYRVDSTQTEYVELSVKYYKIYLNEVKTGGRVGDAADSLGEMLRELDRLGLVGKVRAGTPEQRTVLGVSIAFADKQQASSTVMREIDEDKLAAAPAVEAKAFIDGKPVELDALHPVEAGDHMVRAEAPGYQPAEKQVHVFAGAPQNAELVLEPLPARVLVETEPGASLIVDGRGVGETPHAALPLSGGTHVITVLRTGRKPAAREITVTRDQDLELPIALEPTARRRAVPWVMGAGGVALGVTAVMALGALHYDGKASDHQKLLEQGDQDASVLDDYRRFRSRRDAAVSMTWVASGATLALGVTAAWLYYFDNPSSEGVQVVPFTSGSAGGAVVSGRF